MFIGLKELPLLDKKVKFKIRKLGYSSLGNYPRISRSRDILSNDMSAGDTFSPVARGKSPSLKNGFVGLGRTPSKASWGWCDL